MRRFSWFLGMLVLLAVPELASAQRLTEEPGYDRRGNDYTSFRARDLNDCQRACNRESRCRAYTFDTRSADCYLKDRVNKGERNGVMVTGYKTGSGEGGSTRPPYPGGGRGEGSLTEEQGRDRKGNDYDSFRSRSLDDCKRECRRDSRCQAYTFILSSRECFLKNRINSAKDNRDAVTGYKSTDGDGGYSGGGGLARLTEEYGVDRKGNDYDSFRVRNLTECKQDCRDDSRCQAYTYIQTTRECFLKDRVNSPKGNRDAVTGYKERSY